MLDTVSHFFKNLCSKGKTIPRINLYGYYVYLKYPTFFIEQHKSAPGVGQVFNRLKEAHNDFKDKREKIAERESLNEERKFSTWKKFHSIKFISKRLFLIGIILLVIFMFLPHPKSNIGATLAGVLSVLPLFLLMIVIPICLISKIAEKIAEINYNKYSRSMQDELLALKTEYLEIENICREEMDRLCLESLSERERTEELHHRELVAIQAKNAETISSLNDRLNKIQKENREHNYKTQEDLNSIKEVIGIKK